MILFANVRSVLFVLLFALHSASPTPAIAKENFEEIARQNLAFSNSTVGFNPSKPDPTQLKNILEEARKLCVDVRDAHGCEQWKQFGFYHQTDSTKIARDAKTQLKHNCEVVGFKGYLGENCKAYARVAADDSVARDLFIRSCEAEDAGSCMAMAEKLENESPASAHKFAMSACEHSESYCADALELFEKHPQAQTLENRAIKFCTSSATEDRIVATCNRIARHIFKTGRRTEALALLDTGCSMGSWTDCEMRVGYFLRQNDLIGASKSMIPRCDPKNRNRHAVNLDSVDLFSAICRNVKSGTRVTREDWNELLRYLPELSDTTK